MLLHGNVLFEKEIRRHFTAFTVADRIYFGDTEALHYDKISAEDVTLFL